jgi:hypothetical protein
MSFRARSPRGPLNLRDGDPTVRSCIDKVRPSGPNLGSDLHFRAAPECLYTFPVQFSENHNNSLARPGTT